jgi:hypothetical protein
MEKKVQQEVFNYIDANMHMKVERRKEKHNLVDHKTKEIKCLQSKKYKKGDELN